jgi:hypothetical protein
MHLRFLIVYGQTMKITNYCPNYYGHTEEDEDEDMKDYKTVIHKFLHGLMTETEENEFLKKLSSDSKFNEMVAIETLLYKHCNIASSSNKEITDLKKNQIRLFAFFRR